MSKFFNFFIIALSFICSQISLLHAKPEVMIEKASQELLELGSADYVFHFNNFPKNQDFIISYSRVIQRDFQKYKNTDRLMIDDQDLIHVNGISKAYFYTDLSSKVIAPGERIKLRMSLPNGTILTETSIIPKPICKKSNNGTFFMEAELTSIYPTIYEFSFKGLDKDEKIHMFSIAGSGAEFIDTHYVYKPQDVMMFLPGILGESGGTTAVEITRSTKDRVILQIKWDDEIVKDFVKDSRAL
jgi:hypothetical protein